MPDGAFVFAGTVKKRTVKVLDHEYQTLLPDIDEVSARRQFEFKYAGPDNAFTKTQEQVEKQGYIRIGDSVPDFSAETSMGPINFHEFIGDSWCVFFSHPADFTPVCTTEFGATAKLQPEWSRRGAKVIGLSVDSAEDHERWIADINETQHTQVNFPIIADKDRRVSMLFGMLDTTTFRHGRSLGETMTVRSVFIISPAKRVELIFSYPAYHRSQLRRDPPRARCAATLGEPARGHAGELAPGTTRWCCRSSRTKRRSACSRPRGASGRCAPICDMCVIRRCVAYELPELSG